MNTLTLEAGDLTVAFVPEAGMVGCSLRHRGDELLGRRGGLEAYLAERKTMGIPLLHPWANRVSRRRFTVAGREVDIDPSRTPLRLDGNGLPMHGLLSAARGWEVDHHEATDAGGPLRLRRPRRSDGGVPVRSRADVPRGARRRALTLATTVHATGDTSVPIAFGYHPYLRLPGVARADWRVEIPVRERLLLDEAMLPTGERAPVHVPPGRSARGRSTTPTSPRRTARRSRSKARPPDRAGVRGRLSVRAGLRPARRRCDRLRADDRARQRARRRVAI